MELIAIVVITLAAVGVVVFLAVATAFPPPKENGTNGSVEAEVTRLQIISAGRNLTADDLAPLQAVTENDPKLRPEVEEALWMIDHNYTTHVSHTLNSIYWIAKEGRWVCPADSLSHVGIFLKFNETEMAKDAEKDGEETLDEWIAKAERARKADPSFYPDLDSVVISMKRVISYMKQSDFGDAMDESLHLGEIGYC
ncbi:MAG: hypothetical protein U0R44_01835 [Candidatus Micrarchaeia archaeon]